MPILHLKSTSSCSSVPFILDRHSVSASPSSSSFSSTCTATTTTALDLFQESTLTLCCCSVFNVDCIVPLTGPMMTRDGLWWCRHIASSFCLFADSISLISGTCLLGQPFSEPRACVFSIYFIPSPSPPIISPAQSHNQHPMKSDRFIQLYYLFSLKIHQHLAQFSFSSVRYAKKDMNRFIADCTP